jgi:site-specific recombinase XerD
MKVYANLSITFWLRTPKSLHNQTSIKAIYCRLIVNNERLDFSTSVKIDRRNWCEKTERIKSKNDQELLSNNRLDEITQKLIEAHKSLFNENRPITTLTLKTRYDYLEGELNSINTTNRIGTIIDKYLETVLIQYESNQLAQSTKKAYFCTAKTFSSFLPTIKLDLNCTPDQFNRMTFLEFEKYLLINRRQNTNSAYRVIKQLRQIFAFAYENDMIKQKVDIKSSLKYKNPERKYLTLEEVQILENTPLSTSRLEEVRDALLFSIYTGFAYNELEKLSHNHIKELNGRIWMIISRQKTGNQQKVPLLPMALILIEKYKNHEKANKKDRLFPILCNKEYNRYLKIVQKETKISTRLTTHIGRHTFATTIALSNGMGIESLSKILSHTSIRVTQIYAKVLDTKVAEDFDRLESALNARLSIGEVHYREQIASN